MTGTLAGIARRARSRGAVEVVGQACITPERGIEGDYRGATKGGPHRRQVTLMAASDWADATRELGVVLDWSVRRVNLLVDGLDLPQRAGVRLRVGGAVLQVSCECDPCSRMEAIAPGLEAALTPDWRGGVCASVVSGGEIALGDPVEIMA